MASWALRVSLVLCQLKYCVFTLVANDYITVMTSPLQYLDKTLTPPTSCLRCILPFFFILRGDLFFVLPCVIWFLCFSVLLALRLPRLGKRELILALFVRLFDFCLFGFCLFPLPLGVWEGMRFVIVALLGLFSYLFFYQNLPGDKEYIDAGSTLKFCRKYGVSSKKDNSWSVMSSTTSQLRGAN